jgi:diadenosine tetraphosphate (Ap4A) HIT family hydrolase
MALSKEKIKEIKEHLKSQIQHLPEDKKKEALTHIDSMSSESVELLLKQQSQRQEIFRKIANKQIQSIIIKENNDALAVLEINPISKGHTIIVPKSPVTEKSSLTQETKKLAKEIVAKIKQNLKPKEVKTFAENKFGEIIIDLIPEYDSPVSLDSKRAQSSQEELQKIEKIINTIKIEKKEVKIKKPEPKIEEKKISLPRRIP